MSTLLMTLVLATTPVAGGDDVAPGRPARAGDGRGSHVVLFYGPRHPWLIRWDVQLPGGGIGAIRRAYADRLFHTLDQDGNKLLTRAEVIRVERLGEIATRFQALPRTWKDFDTDPADDQLSPDEFAGVVEGALGAPFAVETRPLRPTQAVDLFVRLDANRDGVLSRAELVAAPARLSRLDLDDDESISAVELDPDQAADRLSAPDISPFVVVSGNADRGRIAGQILARYGSSNPPRVTPEAMGFTAAQLAGRDTDRSGGLDAAELVRFLDQPLCHVDLEARLPDPRTRRSVLLDVNAGRQAPRRRRLDRMTLTADDQKLDLKVRSPRAERIDNTRFYRLQFFIADADKNRYLDESEFPQLNLPNASFAMADSDKNGQVSRDELTKFVEGQAAVMQSRLVLTVTYNSQSLFELLDADKDRRLSPREFRDAAGRLARHDRAGDADGRFTTADLKVEFNLTLEVARPTLFANITMSAAQPVPGAVSQRPEPQAGPRWFRRMDRNLDGDVSRREFLAPRELFDRFDADGDGLINAAEATRGTTRRPADRPGRS